MGSWQSRPGHELESTVESPLVGVAHPYRVAFQALVMCIVSAVHVALGILSQYVHMRMRLDMARQCRHFGTGPANRWVRSCHGSPLVVVMHPPQHQQESDAQADQKQWRV